MADTASELPDEVATRNIGERFRQFESLFANSQAAMQSRLTTEVAAVFRALPI